MTCSPRVSLLVDTDLLDAAYVDVWEPQAGVVVASLRISDVTIINHPDLDPYRLAEALVSWGQAMQDALVDREGERDDAEQETQPLATGGVVSRRATGERIFGHVHRCGPGCGAPWLTRAAYLESLGDRETGR